MARRRRRRSWNSYGSYAVSRRRELSSTFGGIDRDVERLFLALDREDLEELLEVYEEEFGKSAATYARNTFPKWKKGTVRMSGEVAERLLNLLPPLLPDETRFELVKKLRASNFRKVHRRVYSKPESWREDLAPAIAEVVGHGSTARISDAVKSRVSWLANGDVASAEQLLLAAEKDEAITRLVYLEAELRRIETMVAQLGHLNTSISHQITLPQGTIDVVISIPEKTLWQKFKNWIG